MKPARTNDQMEEIARVLRKHGQITRNFARAELYIMNPGARILDLRAAGWKIEGEKQGPDFVYKVIAEPGAQMRLI